MALILRTKSVGGQSGTGVATRKMGGNPEHSQMEIF